MEGGHPFLSRIKLISKMVSIFGSKRGVVFVLFQRREERKAEGNVYVVCMYPVSMDVYLPR
jgi:hypothetical protein